MNIPDDPHPAQSLPSSGYATFSHPMGEGQLPLPRAKGIVRGGEDGPGHPASGSPHPSLRATLSHPMGEGH